jgi:hypothetical protein
MEWNAIQSAPKDGSEFIAFWWEEKWPCVALVHWDAIDHGWFEDEFDVYPTHWMPIPPPPDA